MARSISISKARAQLPALARYLRRSPDQVVFIEHRDMRERLALITEARLRYLESLVEAAAKRGKGTFRLAGSMTSKLADDELEVEIAKIKQEDRELSAAKTGKL
jgi:hypothetical protein